MSLLGNDMAPGVRNELCRRAKIIPDGYGPWTHARIPWIRVSPCIHDDNQAGSQEAFRRKYTLFGGNLQTLNTSYHVNVADRLGPGRTTDTGGSNRNVPKAGVKEVTVEEKGTLGGIKKCTVKFSVWSDVELTHYERHLMTLGKHVLVEWGWNVDTRGSVVKTNLGRSQEQVSKTDSELSCTIRGKQSSEGYCYDALRGMVSNFNWSINEFGGYDCTVELISKGVTYLSTPIETSTMHSGCDEDPDTADSAEGDKGKVHRPNIEQPLVFLREKLASTWDNKEPIKNPGSPNNGYIGMAALFDKELGFMDWVESFFSSKPTNEELEYYITWDYFEEYIVNRKLAPAYGLGVSAGKKDTAQSEPGVDKCQEAKSSDNPQAWKSIFNKWSQYIDKQPRKSDIPYMLDSRGSVTRNSVFLMSADPTKIMLPGQEHWKLYPIKKTGIGNILAYLGGVGTYAIEYVKALIDTFTVKGGLPPSVSVDYNEADKRATQAQKEKQEELEEELADDNVSKTTDKLMSKFKRFDPYAPGTNGPGSSGFGLISNIMINLAFIEEVANEAKTLDDFMDQILQGVQDSLGSYVDLVMCPDPDNPQVMRVIDQNMKTPSNKVKGFHFDGIGRKSIARDISIETDIDSKMAAVVMYGSNKHKNKTAPAKGPQAMGGQGSSEYARWGADVRDLVMADIGLRDSKGQEKGVDCCNQSTGTNDNVADSAWMGYLKSADELANKVTPDASEGMVTAMRKLLNTANPKQGLPSVDDTKVTELYNEDHTITIPLKVGITIDGISGLKWGNMFSFTTSTPIPKRYREYSFQITQVEQKITPGDWTTTLGSVMRPLKCSTYTGCGSNQGSLPTDIVPTTADVVDYELITITDIDVDDDQNTDETQERDTVQAIKMDSKPPGQLETDQRYEVQKAKCPCQDGTHHEDCCEGSVDADQTEKKQGIIIREEVEKTDTAEKGCQCVDGSFSQNCCEETNDNVDDSKDGGDAECKDDIPPVKPPGYTEKIEEEKNPPEDVVVEDKVTEEDCEDWGKLGETVKTGNFIYWPRPEVKIVWYYEWRRSQKHCFFMDLYLWSGIDAQTGRPVFTSMYPPSTTPTKNLVGTFNLFSAAMINRRANLKDVQSITGRKKKDLKQRGSTRDFKYYTGIPNTQKMDLEPGAKDSPGLWTDTHIQFFREDQPYEVWQGPGGMDKHNEWKQSKGKVDYVYGTQKRANGSEKDLMDQWMKRSVFAMMLKTNLQMRRNLQNGVGRVSGGKQYYNPSDIQQLMQDAKSGAVPFGWNQEYFSAVTESDLQDWSNIQYVGAKGEGYEKLQAIVDEWREATGNGMKNWIYENTGYSHG